jgi:integrase
MRTRTKGIQVAGDGGKVVNKQYRGKRIFERLGPVSQDEAEAWLRQQQDRIDGEIQVEQNPQHLFCDAAKQYLLECERRGVRSLETIIYHVSLLLPYIGMKPLELVHNGSFESFKDERVDDDKVSPTTVNRTLEVARTILNRSARVWRGEDGKPWLGAPPLIEMMDENPRPSYPISWDEQHQLFGECPPHIVRPALFAVNTGARDENVCGLRWKWEKRIPELGCSAFVVPAEEYKGKRPHVLILNAVAMNLVESCRGVHEEFVFTYADPARGVEAGRMDTLNNTAYQKARKRAKLTQVRIHDLRHTYAHRLREAGVSKEDRAVLLGHATEGMPEHYATSTVERLVELANRVQKTRDATTLLKVVNG